MKIGRKFYPSAFPTWLWWCVAISNIARYKEPKWGESPDPRAWWLLPVRLREKAVAAECQAAADQRSGDDVAEEVHAKQNP